MQKFLDVALVVACFMLVFVSLVGGFKNYVENNVVNFIFDAFLFSTWGVLGAIKLSDLIKARNNG